MSMCFALVGSQIKRFRTVLRALAAIGSELLVEGVPERLVLRAINSARSAFLAVTLTSEFFESYNVFASTGLVQAGVLIKHVLAAFRSPRVSSMSFELNPEEATLVVTLKCDNALIKRYGLDITASDILQANLDGQDMPVAVVAQSAELNKLLNTFQSTLDEVTIIALPEQQLNGTADAAAVQKAVKIQSFYDPAKGASSSSLHTALSLDSHSSAVFKAYRHSGSRPCDVTINLKDFKALVGLCVEMNADVELKFAAAGEPMLAVPHVPGLQEMDYTAELILATLQESQLAPEEADWAQPAQPAAAAAATVTNSNPPTAVAAVAGGNERAETIAPATTMRADSAAAGNAAAVAATSSDVTPQGGGAHSNQRFVRFNQSGMDAAAAQQHQRAAITNTAAKSASGGRSGGTSGSSRRSGMNRLQRLERQLEEAESERVAPYSRLASSFGQQQQQQQQHYVSGAGGGDQSMLEADQLDRAAATEAGAAGVSNHHVWQQKQEQVYHGASVGHAAGDAVDSQVGDPEELPGFRQQQQQQWEQQQRWQQFQQQPQRQQQQDQEIEQMDEPSGRQWLHTAVHGQQQQQQQQESEVMFDDGEEFPLTPEEEGGGEGGPGAGMGYL